MKIMSSEKDFWKKSKRADDLPPKIIFKTEFIIVVYSI